MVPLNTSRKRPSQVVCPSIGPSTHSTELTKALVPDWPYVDQGLAAVTGTAASSTNAATTIAAVNSERACMTSSQASAALGAASAGKLSCPGYGPATEGLRWSAV